MKLWIITGADHNYDSGDTDTFAFFLNEENAKDVYQKLVEKLSDYNHVEYLNNATDDYEDNFKEELEKICKFSSRFDLNYLDYSLGEVETND